jgi:hypothetical protein
MNAGVEQAGMLRGEERRYRGSGPRGGEHPRHCSSQGQKRACQNRLAHKPQPVGPERGLITSSVRRAMPRESSSPRHLRMR